MCASRCLRAGLCRGETGCGLRQNTQQTRRWFLRLWVGRISVGPCPAGDLRNVFSESMIAGWEGGIALYRSGLRTTMVAELHARAGLVRRRETGIDVVKILEQECHRL
jgi:hypothetical protein